MQIDLFNQQDIETIANRAFNGEQVQVLDYHLERYSMKNIGSMGTHQSFEITIKRHGNSVPEKHQFFVKSMPSLTEEQLNFIRKGNLFGQEASYFNKIQPLLKKSCPDTEDWSPKCLLANDKFVVLEDMQLRNYTMSSSKMLSEDQLRAAFKAQARLHASSLIAEKQLGKPLNKLFPEDCIDALYNENMLTKRLDIYIDFAEKVAGRLGRDSRRLRAGLLKGFFQMYDQNQLTTKLPKVIVHGDPWRNNYLFDTSNPPKCILVDFQMMRYGPPMYDSILLTYFSTNREFREKVIRGTIEAYHEQFCEVLEKNDPEITKPSLDDVLEEYEELRSTALFCSVLYYPWICISKATVEKYSEEERQKKLMFRQDNSFVMQIYDEDKLFANRINDIVQEAVEYFEQRGMPVKLKNGLNHL